MECETESKKTNKRNLWRGTIVIIRGGMGMVIKGKEAKYMVRERNLTFGGEHTIQYTYNELLNCLL